MTTHDPLMEVFNGFRVEIASKPRLPEPGNVSA
jgi:hypothetical protein